MNNKIAIWKRKLAKEEQRQKMRVWKKLKSEFNEPSQTVEDELISDMALQMRAKLDDDILRELLNDNT